MNAVDTNLLVYAHRRELPDHEAAYQLLGELAAGTAAWAIPWPCVAEFFAAVTHARLWKGKQSTPAQAVAQLRAWLDSPGLVVLAETADTFEIMAALVARSGVSGPAIHDARIAAICASHDVDELYTADRDFSRFPGLRCKNPLA